MMENAAEGKILQRGGIKFKKLGKVWYRLVEPTDKTRGYWRKFTGDIKKYGLR